MKSKFAIFALVSGAICCSSLPAGADTIDVVLSIGEKNDGGVDGLGTLAIYQFGLNNITTLDSKSDAAGEITTAAATDAATWLVKQGTAYVLLKESAQDNTISDVLKITTTSATLYSDPQDFAGLNIPQTAIQAIEAGTAPTSVVLLCQNDCGFTLLDGIQATVKIYSDSDVPLPGTLPLFATGLGVLGLLGWRRKRKSAAALPAILGAVLLAGAGSTRASVVTDTATLPLLGFPYIASNPVGCFPAAGVCVSGGAFTLGLPVSSSFSALGQDITSAITYAATLTNLSNVPIGPVQLSGTFEQQVLGRTFATETGSWTTTIIALSLSGPVLGNNLTLMQDPTQQSNGKTSIAPTGDRRFIVDSFFDVFFELKLDSAPPLQTKGGPIHVTAVTPLPAALPLFATGLGALVLLAWRRKQKQRVTS